MVRAEVTEYQLGGIVLEVVLSERNLLALLSKLYTAGSRREIGAGDVPPGIALMRIRVEADDVHYRSPSRDGEPPGAMHPVTEHVLRAIRTTIDELQADHPIRLSDE